MEISGNPLLEAEEWRESRECRCCGVHITDISVDDITYIDEYNHAFIRCGFCGDEQTIFSVPNSVQYSWRKNKKERQTKVLSVVANFILKEVLCIK
jgi:hypothetical protein